jgi:ketosteroid isomerase-like protein
MKRHVVLVCSICIAFLCAVPVFAQDDAEEAEHEALRGLKAVFEEAVNKNELDLLKPYLDKDFSVVTFTDREFTDFEKFKVRWQQTRDEMLKGGTYSIKLLPVRSQIIGDIAITKGDSENVMVTGCGEEFKFTAHWTAVCRKSDGKWKIVRGHNSLDPFGNPMLKAGVKKIVIKIAAGTAIAGLLAGLVIGLLIGRRKRA